MPHHNTFAANPHWLPKPRRGSLAHLPGEDGLPLIGNTFRVLRDPIAFTDRMVATYGRVYRNTAFGGPSAVLVGPEANELVLFDRDHLFSSEQGWGPLLNLLFPRGLMLMDFDRHRADRRVMSVAFKPQPMRHYAAQLDAGIARRVEQWPSSTFLVYDAIKSLSLDLAATSFLGVPLGAAADRINHAFIDEVQASVAPVRIPLPGTAMRRGVEARRYLVDFFRSEIPRRRDGDGEDFFSIFCRATDEDGEPLGADAIADHMNFLMMAAHDTITSSATSLILYLGRHPEWQERLRAEIALVGDEGGSVAFDDLDRLVLCDHAFREALRLMPPVPAIARRALRDFSFGGHAIPAGSFIGINPAYTHRMAEHWPDPDVFDPMRFAPEISRHRHKFAWVPFGGGAHMCIGLHFATMQIRILLAHLLTRYDIVIDAEAGAKWQVFPIPRPRDGLPIRLVPRRAIA